MGMLKELPELVEAGVISEETAERIRAHYRQRRKGQRRWLPIVFGILGALLAGLGAILIIAQNWSELSRYSRTVLSFLPLLITQGAAAFVLIRKEGDRLWTESVGILLLSSVGASLALISQTYHLQGLLADFVFVWMLLTAPIAYVLRSPSVSLLYLLGISFYAHVFSWDYDWEQASFYWLLFLLILPVILYLYKRIPRSNFMVFHNWLMPLSLAYGLSTLFKTNGEFILPAQAALCGCFFLLGQRRFFLEQGGKKNGFRRWGQLGTLIILFATSFEDYWSFLDQEEVFESGWALSPGMLAWLFLMGAAGVLSHRSSRRSYDPLEGVWALVAVLFVIGLYTEILPLVAINLYLLYVAVHRMVIGASQERLSSLNLGALIFAGWILCRFFELDLSFLTRGIIFILLGLGFFGLNYWMLQKRGRSE